MANGNQSMKNSPDSEIDTIPGRRESRANVIAANLSDEDIDRLIKQAQRDVEPGLA